jgi:hypothetical protein
MRQVNRFAVYWLSQDGEPELVARPIAHFPTLDEARDFGTEYASDTSGGYVALKDRETDIWIER